MSVAKRYGFGKTNVKSPVASLCLVCSSVKNRVSVTISVLIFSPGPESPLRAILDIWYLVWYSFGNIAVNCMSKQLGIGIW
jgi:hypothetical protein